MKIRVRELRRILREANSKSITYTFEVYGPDDEAYTVTATYNPRTPFDVEIWKATDASGNEVDVDELGKQHDLHAIAMDTLAEKHPTDDMDPPSYRDEF